MPRIGGTGPKRPVARRFKGKTGKMLFLEEGHAVFGSVHFCWEELSRPK